MQRRYLRRRKFATHSDQVYCGKGRGAAEMIGKKESATGGDTVNAG